MNSTSVSRREAEVIDAVSDRDLIVFRPRDVSRFLATSARNTYRILDSMVEKDLARRITKGVYVLTETYENRDSYEIVTQLEPASYLAFWSALHFHGLTEQVPTTVFVAVTKQKRSVTVQGQSVKFVRIDPKTFFGYDWEGDVVVSDREKTILDCLRMPKYAGGIPHIYEAIPSDLDVDQLVRYAERLGSGAVAARAGYLLERRGLIDGNERLQALVSSYAKLDPSGDSSEPIARWKLYANVDVDDRS